MQLPRERRSVPSLGLALLLSIMGLAWALPLAEIAAAQASPVFRTNTVRDVPLKNLADWILRSPHAEKMTSQEGVLTAQVVQRQEGPAQRTIYVQRHSTGQVDIVFIVVTESEDKYFYRASLSGKLLKAAHIHGTVDPIANRDALEAFQHERDFWLGWTEFDHGSSPPANTPGPTSRRDH
jgi:hypothetical protein